MYIYLLTNLMIQASTTTFTIKHKNRAILKYILYRSIKMYSINIKYKIKKKD